MSTKSLPWGLVVGFALFQGLSVEMWAQGAPTLRVAHDQSKREIILELGPFDFPANAPHEAVRQPDAQTVQLPVGGWIHGFRVELVDGHGRPVSQQVLHHVNVISPDERELFSQIMLRVAAAGQETGPVVLPRMVGYRIREGQRVLVTAAFHNPTPSTYRDVVLRVRLPYTPADAWLRPVTGFPLYMDVMPPASVHAYDLPPGRSVKSWEGSPAVPGRILGLGGHLHKYGVVLRLEDVTEGKILWEAEPILDAEGEVIGMPMKKFLWTLGIPIRPDHVYRLTAIYENPTGETIPDGAMGALGGLFIPAPGYAWPTADPKDDEYRLDVEIVTSGAYGHGGHGGHGGKAGRTEHGERDGRGSDRPGAHDTHDPPGGAGGHGAHGGHGGHGAARGPGGDVGT